MADDLQRTLERVGERLTLGEYEIEAYLAVLEHGELTASEVAEATGVPQPRVYDTARSLADRGLVELRESRPMKIVAVDPEEAFGDVESSLVDLVASLSARYTAPARDTEAVTLVKSRATILRHVREVIESAEYELLVSLTPDLLRRFREPLTEAVDRGTSVELVVAPAERAPAPETFDYDAVSTTARARRGITTPVVAVADGTYSVYTTQDALREELDRYGVIFDRSALGFLVSGFFGTVIWTTADPLADADEPGEFPRTYATIRRAVKDLDAHGGEARARVEGRDVETGTPTVVEGPVTSVRYDPNEEVASFTVDGADGPVTVGGRVAALEDVEAHEIRVEPGRND
ncbi:MAG: transcriptional regulator [uncultured archaeon A07HB70]|nr:MAG: transcriptional regulator [uncultured archaeon A07HB70]